MKHIWIAMLLSVMLAGSALASSHLVPGSAVATDGSETVTLPPVLIGWDGGGELDEIVGDTVHVGSSPWDAQHNSKAARQVAFYDGDPWEAHVIWAKLFGLTPSSPRHTVYTRVLDDGAGGLTVNPDPAVQLEDVYRSGYSTLAFMPEANIILPGFHVAINSGDPFHSTGVMENPFIPYFYNMFPVPSIYTNPHVWPMSVYGDGGNGGYLHMISHEQRTGNTDPMEISYFRWEVDTWNSSLWPATPNDDPILITDIAMNISGDVATSTDGSQVAIAACITRHESLGEAWGIATDSQVNNDVWVFLSDDYGATWDLDNPVDATQFIGPEGTSPGDTMRTYADCSVIFDDEDRLRVAFSAAVGNALDGTSTFVSRLYHYMQDDSGNDWWTMIHHQPWPGYAPESWGRTTDRPCLYFDDDSGILWCMFRAYGGGEYDFGTETGLGNGDIYISASPPGAYNGLLWTEAVNITNTNWTSPGGAPIGDCQSEMSPAMALDSDGDYLHISYLLDLDAGVAISSAPEGVITENPYVYHRVAKQELLDLFETNAAWVENFPMHHDGTGAWEDPGGYEWADYGGFFTGNREPLPASLDLIPLSATIPPAGGTVTYQVHFTSGLPNTIPGVMYWTMATLPNGNAVGPLLQQPFTVTPFMDVTVPAALQVPGWAPAGMYDFYGHVGFYPNAVLSDSFMFWKLNGVAAPGGPNDFSHSEIAFDTAEEAGPVLPEVFALSEARPNPFNPVTEVTVSLPETAELTVAVFNVMGRQVAELARGSYEAGDHRLVLDGSGLASGVYFIHAHVPGKLNELRKVTLLK